jgi:hypothetical protein
MTTKIGLDIGSHMDPPPQRAAGGCIRKFDDLLTPAQAA